MAVELTGGMEQNIPGIRTRTGDGGYFLHMICGSAFSVFHRGDESA